ncbi:MAG: hypothetical protein KDA87_09475 [Planctomycetales bacterium]|nr:hypothetical protein [Planctomycetales bacterium]
MNDIEELDRKIEATQKSQKFLFIGAGLIGLSDLMKIIGVFSVGAIPPVLGFGLAGLLVACGLWSFRTIERLRKQRDRLSQDSGG